MPVSMGVMKCSVGSLALVALGAWSLVACSQEPGASGSSSNPLLVDILADARANGAGEEEVAVIEAALAEGRGVTFEEYKEAANRSMECLQDLGFDVVNYKETQKTGWIQITYGYGGVSDEEFEELDTAAQACEDGHIKWMQFAYQLNSSDGDVESVFEEFRPAMIECVNNNGGSLPQDATIEEAMDADFEIYSSDSTIESCVVTTGLVEWL